MTRPLPSLFPPESGDHLTGPPGASFHVRAESADTDGELGVVDVVLQPGALGAAPHIHREHAEHFHVLEGAITFDTDDGVKVMGADGIVSVPRGAVHGFRNSGDVAARVRLLFTPAGYEDYFRAIDAALTAGEVLDAAALIALRAGFATDPAPEPGPA